MGNVTRRDYASFLTIYGDLFFTICSCSLLYTVTPFFTIYGYMAKVGRQRPCLQQGNKRHGYLPKANRYTGGPLGVASRSTLLGCLSRPLGVMLAASTKRG
jgi:hypothetical protein